MVAKAKVKCPECGKVVERLVSHQRMAHGNNPEVREGEPAVVSQKDSYSEIEDLAKRIDSIDDEDLKAVLLKKIAKGISEPPSTANLPVASSTQEPGTTIGVGLERRKVRYSKRWLEGKCNAYDQAAPEERDKMAAAGHFHWVQVEPAKTTWVTWNGCRYGLVAGEVNRVPSPIADVYRQSVDADKHTMEAKPGDDPRGLAFTDPNSFRAGWIHSSQTQ
jgi:hypothetical protein